jgi:tryptophan-rich sensory protein
MGKTLQVSVLFIFIALCLGAAGLGAIATTPEIDGWYRTLAKPTWNPPDWVFGPVWTTLYVMMAVAAWLAWRVTGWRSAGLGLFAFQLVLNIAWSWVFFGMHQVGWACIEIVFLWLAIAATTIAFFQRARLAGWLMLPYLVWVTFASVLNFAIWRMNSPEV